ncbi:hypothetical protein AOZ06_19515 [Kibdelosporangium phytohabitans]|uniref:Uncharacterized protein n=2 Tax=Kibdelosporangium phytohabitans TaxID=860235 RepID=A0A0N9I941_9PSEU|nr:hypothetical protein AOZ06_19515 [Kibdelosporangium phytohabitans]
MHAQLTFFDGPRSPAEIAAADYAGRNRIQPALAGFDVRTYVLRRDDGSAVIITFAEDEQTLLDAQKAVLGTALLPDEDPALLPGADRVEIYPVVRVTPEGA